jgi:hypothetical protein
MSRGWIDWRDYLRGTPSASPPRASSHHSGRELSPVLPETGTTRNYSVNYARSGPNSCSALTAPLAHFDLAAPRAILHLDDFHRFFAGWHANQGRKSRIEFLIGTTRLYTDRTIYDSLQTRSAAQ